jgi:serine/threonine protein kinase
MFMPLESLERYYYSSRTDSFAIGILIYFLVFRQFPWMSYT